MIQKTFSTLLCLLAALAMQAQVFSDYFKDSTLRIDYLFTGNATKQEVKAAIELLFKVQVESVQMVNVKGKTAHFGRFAGKHSDVRKAYVTLKSGQEINFAEVK